MTTTQDPSEKTDLRIYAGLALTVVGLAGLVAIPILAKIVGVWGLAWGIELIGLLVGLFLLALPLFENLAQARENKARENWDPIVTWKYENSEWDRLRHHHLETNKFHLEKSQKRLQITWQLFVILGLVLFISVGLAGDWLVGTVLGIIVGGFGAGLVSWQQRGEQKDATKHLSYMTGLPAIDNSYIVEIAMAGYSVNDDLQLWGSERTLGQISIVEEPLPAIQFEYIFWQSDKRLMECDLIPIPEGHEQEAEKLVRRLQ